MRFALFGRRAHLGAEGGAKRARHSLRRLDVGLLRINTADPALRALLLWEEKERAWVSDRALIRRRLVGTLQIGLLLPRAREGESARSWRETRGSSRLDAP